MSEGMLIFMLAVISGQLFLISVHLFQLRKLAQQAITQRLAIAEKLARIEEEA